MRVVPCFVGKFKTFPGTRFESKPIPPLTKAGFKFHLFGCLTTIVKKIANATASTNVIR